ncbi:hypothetical protein NM688_g235 [Phlebia brevispora]|uniref:Uncharacterized protein n=1 Tax=Phlebia brevispora TaxID=194682 RepID=A0ACC1TFA9_9APHY|nr:hypothetical protein NM688_g235 [Phlebia brevispora]
MDALESVRPAGLLERYHITRCELGVDSCVIASAQYISNTGLPLDNSRLYPALQKVIMRQPSLTMQVVGESEEAPRFVRLRSIDLTKVVEDCASSFVLEEAFLNQIARPFKIECDEALWRLARFADGTVLFIFHHAIGDGQSGISFHMALLRALNDLSSPSTTVDVPPSFLPAVDTLMDTTVSWRKFLHEAYSLFAPESWRDGFDAWTGNPVSKKPTLHTNIRSWEISPPDTRRLLKLCRQHNCTLTAFLYVLSIEVLSHIIVSFHPQILEKYKTLSTNVAMSLRRFTGTPLDVICDQAAKFHCFTPIINDTRSSEGYRPEDFPWNRAVEFGATLHSSLGVGRQDIGSMRYLFGHFREYFGGQLGKKRESTFTISNIGRFPTQYNEGSTDEWRIGKMYFGQCDATAGAAIKLNVVGAPDGSLGSTFTWGESSIDHDIAQSFVETMKKWTSRIISQANLE